MKELKFEEYPLNVPVFEELESKFKNLMQKFKNCNTAKEQYDVMLKMGEFFDDVQTDFTIISVKHSLDTKNEEYKKAKDITDELGPMFQSLSQEYNEEVLKSKFRTELENVIGIFLFKILELNHKTFHDSIIEDLQQENKLCTEYDNLMASAEIEYEGQIYNLEQMGKFVQDKDRTIRRNSSKKVEEWMEEKEAQIADIYSKLVKLRTEMAEKLGYDSFTSLAYARMGRTDWSYEEARSYRDQILETAVPFAVKLTQQKTKRTGVERPQFYDLNFQFLDGNPTPKGDKERLVKAAQEMYDEMGTEIGSFFGKMVENNLLDLEAKSGKMNGGYMTYFPRYKMPFVFSNFNGTSGDVDVLTHEIGHAFQGYMSKDILPTEYRTPTMEECEIHSMSMEFLATPWMDKFFKEDKEKYLLGHLEEAIIFLPYGATVDEFQHWVYDNPEATHEQRCEKWREIEKKYTPFKEYEGFPFYDKGSRWMRQSHIFTSPFYYIDYTLAQVVALQFLGLMIENYKQAWEKYVKVCSLGGKHPFTELLKEANLENPFLPGTIERTFKSVERIMEKYTLDYNRKLAEVQN